MNSTLNNITAAQCKDHQLMQNNVARTVSKWKSYHIGPVPKNLLRLPVQTSEKLKALLLVCKRLERVCTVYLSSMLGPFTPLRLRELPVLKR